MSKFLWKPISEKGGLAILADGVTGVSLVDMNTGQEIEKGNNTGASNGYGGTFRFSMPGSNYNNVAVVDDAGNIIKQIATGSQRVQGVTETLGQAGSLAFQRPGSESNELASVLASGKVPGFF